MGGTGRQLENGKIRGLDGGMAAGHGTATAVGMKALVVMTRVAVTRVEGVGRSCIVTLMVPGIAGHREALLERIGLIRQRNQHHDGHCRCKASCG